MKHNHTTKRVQKSGVSSYKRHQKREFLYSENYNGWRRAFSEGRHHDARDEARKHSMRFLGFDATNPEERRRQDRLAAEHRMRVA